MQRRHAVLAIKVAVTLAFLAGMAWKLGQGDNWARIREGLVKIRVEQWLLAWLGFLAGHALGIWKWRYNVNLVTRGERRRLRGVDATQCYAGGMFANICLPSIVGGDALKAILAGRVTGRLEAPIIGGLIERLLDTLALLVLIVIGAIWSRDSMPGWAQSFVMVAVVVVAAGALLFLPLVLRMPLRRWPRRVRRSAGRALVAIRHLATQPQRALLVFALSLAIQSWFVLLNRWLGSAIGVDAPLAVWFFAVPMTKAITLAPISFGGFGLREVTLGKFLAAMAGIPESGGWAASGLWQSVLITTGLLGGLLWWALGYRRAAKIGAGHGSLMGEARAAGSREASATGSRDARATGSSRG
jgi:hypothetical protein